MKIGLVLLPIVVSLLAGCASPYRQFYRPAGNITPEIIAANRSAPPPAEPLVERRAFTNAADMLDSYRRRGYSLIGSSSFNSGVPQYEAAAVSQAKDVKADLVVIFDPKYTGSTTSSVPITSPTTSRSVVSGPGGTGTITTYGTSTSFVPVTVNRMDYGAAFFVKGKVHLGVAVRDLTNTERQEIQSNKGVVVQSVVDNSPAYMADLLPGDIIIAIDGMETMNVTTSMQLMTERNGKAAKFSILRRGTTIEKIITLNP